MDLIEVTIQNLGHSGEGVARHAGRVVFIPFALPGETVRAEIVSAKKGFTRARLREVVTAAPERVPPVCPHYFTPGAETPACGGCQLQHLAYPAQARFKQTLVTEQLQRVGGITAPPVRPILVAPAPLGYRNQVQFTPDAEGRLGFNAAGADTVVPVRECPIAAPALMELFQRIQLEDMPDLERVTVRAGAEEELLIVFEAGDEPPEVELDLPVAAALLRPDDTALALAGRTYLVETVKGRAFQISAGVFFQVNTAVAERLVDEVLAALGLRSGETVLDLYCGAGLFAAFLAPIAGRVIGVEAYEPAVEDAAVNLDEFNNVEIYAAPAEEVLPGLSVAADAVLVDPPRAGLAPAVTAALIALGAPRLVYVSCDPATLARDAKLLIAGGYTLDYVQPLDMFPQTHHVENVARFSRPAA